ERTYEEILNIDDVIQRKIFFVEHKMRNMKQGEVSQRYYLKRAYLAPWHGGIHLYKRGILFLSHHCILYVQGRQGPI
ncbi:hypothetical protein HMPREF9470_04741, partial [[Clostridium] citroniae WAL-19142]